MGFTKPNVVISNCLELSACRYNGQVVKDDFVKKLTKHVNYIPVCPEVAIGLGTPRFPIRIVSRNNESRLIQPATGIDVTEKMAEFTRMFLEKLRDVDGFILKFRSPSCGMKDVRIYASAEKAAAIGKTSGFFGGVVMNKFRGLAIEDEGRLRSLRIREHFLTKLFTLARFRALRKKAKISTLANFHAASKFLLMTYNQHELRILGNVAANRAKLEIDEVVEDYDVHLKKALENPPKRTASINTLTHILGYFSKDLTRNEKRFFLETVDLYREGRVPFTSTIALLKGWSIRFQNEYLLQQTLFEPYPIDLLEWTDAGRPIEL
jgi:uncharacterized protein YbgA (DUF1722 family)/uncharacterized protein YbbK (DUF523 family)